MIIPKADKFKLKEAGVGIDDARRLYEYYLEEERYVNDRLIKLVSVMKLFFTEFNLQFLYFSPICINFFRNFNQFRFYPDVLLSGHHKNIETWRMEQSVKRTKERRPDLLENG